MKSSFAIAFAIGLGVVGLVVCGILYVNAGAHLDLPGKFLKVRTVSTGDANSVAVVDFRITNPSDYPFVVRTVSLLLENNAGDQTPGMVSSEVDAKRFFDGTPSLGEKFEPTLITMEKVPPRTTEDRMVLAQFNAPESVLQSRKRFVVRVEEIDGKVFDISEK